MMSRKLFISALWGISIILCIFTGCRTNSSRSEEYFGEETVWDILHRGDSDRAREYFMGSVDVNDTDMEGRTPLHLAAEIEDPALASFFVALGAHVDIEDDEGRTPLDISSTIRDGETAKILIAAGANIYHPMEGGGSPATTAVRDETFLAAILGPESIGSLNQEGQTILHIAADEGAARAVDAIVAAGAQVDARDNQGRTPLDLAYSHPRSRGHAETAEHLILAGGSSSNPFNPYFTLAVRNSNFNLRNSDSMTPTHYAARQDYMGFLEFMLDRDADPNIKNASGITPLLEAVRAGNAEAVKLLLDRGALVDVQDARGNSVLHIALNAVNYQETLPLLLSYGAKPNFRDDNGDSPLHRAILLNRQPETISGLLAGGADVSLRNRSGKTPLFLAVQQNQANVIPLLLAYKSDIFASDNSGQSPFEKALADRSFVLASLITPETVLLANSQGDNLLHIAVKNRADLGIIGLALDYKAPVNARNKEGETPLHIAVRLDEGEIGELLLSRGADIFAPNGKGESSLYLAFFPVNGRPATQSTLRRWMLNPPALDARDGLGNTPLHYVAQWKLDTFIPLMVQMGANTEAVNATGETSLFAAVKQDSPSTIQALFAAGASANARDTLGNTAIHAAVRWNAQNAAQSLISKGMDINSHALNGKTPLHDAVRLGIVNLETLLIRSGAQLEARDNEGNTPFMEALMAGIPATLERLVGRGADPGARNIRGDTPLHLAVATERSDLVSLLLGWGVSIHAKNAAGRTPFQIALGFSRRMVSTLLTRDRMLASDDNGNSPLHIAIQENAPPYMLKVILDQGARIGAVDSDGRTSLRLAVDKDSWELAKNLAEAGSDVFSLAKDNKTPADIVLSRGKGAVEAVFSGKAINSRDSLGNTILHYAARAGSREIISQLLDLGGNKTIRNYSSETPADIALRWRHPEAASLLR